MVQGPLDINAYGASFILSFPTTYGKFLLCCKVWSILWFCTELRDHSVLECVCVEIGRRQPKISVAVSCRVSWFYGKSFLEQWIVKGHPCTSKMVQYCFWWLIKSWSRFVSSWRSTSTCLLFAAGRYWTVSHQSCCSCISSQQTMNVIDVASSS